MRQTSLPKDDSGSIGPYSWKKSPFFGPLNKQLPNARPPADTCYIDLTGPGAYPREVSTDPSGVSS